MLPQEEKCPVDESLLGELYRSSSQGLHALVETITPASRARLALYCYRRAHLSDLGLAIASTCEQQDLVSIGGEAGSALFVRSRTAPAIVQEKRRKITLSNGSAFTYAVSQDLV